MTEWTQQDEDDLTSIDVQIAFTALLKKVRMLEVEYEGHSHDYDTSRGTFQTSEPKDG